jgi:hypothetical protein
MHMEGLISWIMKSLIIAAFAAIVYLTEVRKKRLISP